MLDTGSPARLRLAALEQALGEPADPADPVGRSAVLAAEDAARLPAGGEEALARFGLHEEFVPEAHGGASAPPAGRGRRRPPPPRGRPPHSARALRLVRAPSPRALRRRARARWPG